MILLWSSLYENFNLWILSIELIKFSHPDCSKQVFGSFYTILEVNVKYKLGCRTN